MYRHCLICATILFAGPVAAEPVTLDTIVRAETDTAIRTVLADVDFGTFQHIRQATPLDQQSVIRMNRDTLYSMAIIDLSTPVTLTLPEVDGRYMSVGVINQDHYVFVLTNPGQHTLTKERVGSRYGYLLVRTFMDPDDPDDIVAAHAAQDSLKIEGGSDGPFDAPDWDKKGMDIARSALSQLGKLGGDSGYSFGTAETTKPMDHLIGAVLGWGGLPKENAFYVMYTPKDAYDVSQSLTVKNVPVGAFWSVTVYDSDGFIEPNDLSAYSFNNVTAAANEDGSFTINFGGCEDGRENCLPIAEGWNYLARLYEPGAEVLDGSWVFPEPERVK